MNDKIKNALGIVIILFLLILSYAGVAITRSYSKATQPTAYRSFTVSAEGKAVSIPDIAEFNFSVISEGGKNIATLQKTNTDKVNKAIDYLKQQGIDKKDIKTENYNVSPKYQYYSCDKAGVCPPAEITGYTITQSIDVKIRNFDKIGDVLTGVVTAGANDVSQLNFTMDDPKKPQDDARNEAIAKAKDKAKEIAKAGGFSVGQLLSIEEGNQQFPTPMYLEAMDSAKSARGGASVTATPTVEPGSQETKITVTLKYEIN